MICHKCEAKVKSKLWKPENSGIGSYDFKYSNEHEGQHLFSVNRPISLNK